MNRNARGPLHDAKQFLRSIGIVLTKNEYNEYRVNFYKGREETAHYTNDLKDAVDTGKAMARQGDVQLLQSGTKVRVSKEGPHLVSISKNPRGKKVLIYGAVNRIIATKTQRHICDAECKKHGHRYYHDFSSTPRMYGLPDGSLLITSR